MAEHTIRFHDGYRMPWPTFRKMMLGEISPPVAVARARREREPAGALDAAMRRGGRDQQVGRLDASYCRATDQFLHNSGLPDEDVEAVMQILSKYAEEESAAEDAENMNMREDPRIRVGGPCGQIGAQDRRLALDALDQFGKPRRRCDATAERTDQAGWGSRFRPPEERGLTTPPRGWRNDAYATAEGI